MIAAAITTVLRLPARAQDVASPSNVDLVVEAGRPLRIALDERVNVKRVGQPVAGTLVDPLYAYDRIVVEAGTKVRGRVTALDPPAKLVRVQSLAAGDFSPNNRVVIRFDALVFGDGRELPIRTVVNGSAERMTLSVAADDTSARAEDRDGSGVVEEARQKVSQARQKVAQARRDAIQKARDTLSAIKSPGKMDRVKAALVRRLPYHPQYLSKGTVFDADLLDALDFGPAPAAVAAPAGTAPAPESILNARLLTALDSSKAKRGEKVEAIVVEPVFSADHRLVLPEGSRLVGEVTLATPARRWHRNGRLRFLFESVQPPKQDAMRLPASLYSVQLDDANAVSVDDEGGTRASESKTRFIAPALAVLALRASRHREHRRFDNDADDSLPGPAGNPASRGAGGFFGWGIAGAAVSQISRPIALALAAVGVAQTTYSSVFGPGREVTFPPDTAIQVQLAPGPASGQ